MLQHEADLHPGDKVLNLLPDFLQRGALLGQTADLQNDTALTHAQILGVDDQHIVKICCGQTGVLVAGGEAGAQIHLNHGIIGRGVPGKDILIFSHADGGGGAQVTPGSHMVENLFGGNGDAVPEVLSVLDDIQRGDGNIVFLKQLLRQIAGAVGDDFDIHSILLIFRYRRLAPCAS